LQEVNMPVAHRNNAGGSAKKLMKVIFIKIGTEFHLMEMVAVSEKDFLT